MEIKPGKYRHFKGNLYEGLDLCCMFSPVTISRF